MNAKEKAIDLLDKYRTIIRKTDIVSEDEIYLSKECAIIAVDEILKNKLLFFNQKKYWQQVKVEIKNL